MTDEQFEVLEQRIDGVARVLLSLIADFEVRECIDGNRFSAALRRAAENRRQAPGKEASGGVMLRMCDELDEARSRRSEGC